LCTAPHLQRLLVENEHLLAHSTVRHPHLAVVRGLDDDGVVQQFLILEGIENVFEVLVGLDHQVAVEVEVLPLLLVGQQRP
jgi:hypothetical protein